MSAAVTDNNDQDVEFFLDSDAADTNVEADDYSLDFDDVSVGPGSAVADVADNKLDVGEFTSSQWPQSYKYISSFSIHFSFITSCGFLCSHLKVKTLVCTLIYLVLFLMAR